jgi:hypothetical protein
MTGRLSAPPGTGKMRTSLGRAERLAVLVVIAVALFYRLDSVPFHPDESQWIALSAPFEAFFQGRFTDPIWQTRPERDMGVPVTYYVIGVARRIGGWPPDRLNAPYRFFRPHDKNLAQGRVPEPGLLWWARAGVTATAIAAVFASFLLFERASSRWAAYLWLTLTLVNPYLRDTLRRAMNEGVLLAALGLVMWATCRALVLLDMPLDRQARLKALAWVALAGLGVGLAAQTKMNGGIAVFGVLLALTMAFARTPLTWRFRCREAVLAATILAVCSTGMFVGANPTLWPNPARGTLMAVRARAEAMQAQTARSPNLALPSFKQRILVVPKRVFFDDAIVPRAYPTVLLFLLGVGWTAARLGRWLRGEHESRALVVLTLIGLVVSIPALFTPLDWPRYFLLPVFFSSFHIVLGMEWLARRIWRASLNVSRRGR